jgi:hypothetical protein
MRNPVQEYSLARSMPIKALAAVLQGTSDMVSLIAAHTVLREKMEAVVAEKGMQAMQSAQAPKIKDKDLAMAQGLGASPADIDVPMGGIVGGEGTFGTGAAGGGSVVAFQGRWAAASSDCFKSDVFARAHGLPAQWSFT